MVPFLLMTHSNLWKYQPLVKVLRRCIWILYHSIKQTGFESAYEALAAIVENQTSIMASKTPVRGEETVPTEYAGRWGFKKYNDISTS